MVNIFIVIILAYLIGNFCSAYVIGKLIFKKDIRDYGSGNAGATNALRVFGKKAGAIAFVGDALKGGITVIIGGYILSNSGNTLSIEGMYLAGVFVAVGHNWPVILNFKGGKGIATTIGAVSTINPLLALSIIVIGVIIIYKTKYVSLGSLLGSVILPIIVIFLVILDITDVRFLILSSILSIMAVLKHRSNLVRLINGTERKLGQKV